MNSCLPYSVNQRGSNSLKPTFVWLPELLTNHGSVNRHFPPGVRQLAPTDVIIEFSFFVESLVELVKLALLTADVPAGRGTVIKFPFSRSLSLQGHGICDECVRNDQLVWYLRPLRCTVWLCPKQLPLSVRSARMQYSALRWWRRNTFTSPKANSSFLRWLLSKIGPTVKPQQILSFQHRPTIDFSFGWWYPDRGGHNVDRPWSGHQHIVQVIFAAEGKLHTSIFNNSALVATRESYTRWSTVGRTPVAWPIECSLHILMRLFTLKANWCQLDIAGNTSHINTHGVSSLNVRYIGAKFLEIFN